MATKDYYKGITIQYKGDDTQLSKVLANMNSQMRQSQGAARQLDSALKMDPTSLNLIRDRAEVVAKQIKLTEERVRALKDALGKAEDPEVITRLTQQVDIAEARLKGLNDQMTELGKQQNMGSGLGQLATNAQNVGESIQAVGDKMSSVGDTMTKHLTVPIVGFSTAAIGAATTVDTALTDVRKTVDGTEEDYQRLKDAAIEYSKTNAVSADQVLQVQALGAQLSYTLDELEMIGRVGSGLDIATDMNAEQATTDMAQFANITKMAHSESENYASTVVALGNTTATTESKISSMAQRIAAAGSQVGISNSEILGLAAGLSSVGMEAEAGGTAISTIISQIDKDVATGSENVATWAETAGMSAEQFASAWRSGPTEALEALLTNMGSAADAGGNMSVMLENLGIKSIRQTDAMKRLAGNSEALATAIDTANRAWQENTALSEEVANRNDSLSAKMEMVRNRVTAILEKIGKPLADALLDALDAAEPLFDAIESGAKAFSDMDKEQQRAIVSALALAAAFGPVLSVVGRATGDVGSLITALGGGANALAMLGEAAPVAGAALLGAFATKEIVEIVGGYVQNLELIKDATVGVAEVTTIAGGSVEGLAESVNALSESEGGASESTATLSETLRDATDGLRSAADYAKEAKDTLGELGTNSNLVDQYAETMKELSSQSELTAAEQERLKNAVEQYNSITGAAIEVTDATRGALSLLPGQIDEVTAAYKRQAEQKAYIDLYNDAIKAQIENEMELEKVSKQMGSAAKDAAGQIKGALDPLTAISNARVTADLLKLRDSFNGLEQSSVDLAGNVSFLEDKLEGLSDGSYQFSSLEAAMSAAGVTGQQYANLTQEQLEQIRASFDGTIASISGVLAKFGISVGATGERAVAAVKETANNVASGVDTGARKASDAQRKANDRIIKDQQKANERIVKEQQKVNEKILKEQQKANERYNKQLQKQQTLEYKQRSKELSAEEELERKSNQGRLDEQKKQFELQEKQLKSSLDRRYSERSKALAAEVDAERKKNEKILKDLKASQAAEVKQYKAATDARIKEIDREYQEKAKLLEDRDGTKEIDSRIKQLESESEAEKRINTDKDRAEKVAELQREVDRAKSRRKRAEAEKALNDYLAEIAYEQREQERKGEIDRLEEQKSLIKEETAAKKDALEEQAENAKEQYRQQRDERLEQIQTDNELEYEKRKEALDLEIEQRREQNAQILEDLKSRNDEQMQQMRDLHEQQTASYKEMLDNRLAAMREAHETELENLKEQQSEVMDQVRESQQEELDALRDSQQEQLDALRESQQAQLDALRDSLDSQVDAVSSGGSAMVDSAEDAQGKLLVNAEKAWDHLKKSNKAFTNNIIKESDGCAKAVTRITSDTGRAIVKGIEAVRDPASKAGYSVRMGVNDSMSPIETELPNKSQSAVMNFVRNIENGKSSAGSASSGLRSSVMNYINGMSDDMGSEASRGSNAFASNIADARWDAAYGARSLTDAVEDELSSLQDYSETWGWNTGINFTNGLSSTVSYGASAAASLARSVSSYLHHSTPEKGPLHGDDRWGAELVDNFLSSMRSKESELADQSRRLAGIVSDEFAPELSARYDANLNIATAAQAQQRKTQWWQQNASPSIYVDVHMDKVSVDSSMDIRQTARDLAFETARQLASSLG